MSYGDLDSLECAVPGDSRAACARIGYAALVSGWIEDPDTLAVIDIGMTVANGGFAAFQFAEAGVELFSPWE